MKFFHYSAGTVSRSSGRSCVQAVAYITRSELFESRRGINANYTYAKDHDVTWETMAPEGSGIGKKDLSIWDMADLSEDIILSKRHKDPGVRERNINSARPAYDDEFSLPKELTREQNIDLVRDYVNTKFISKGLVATWSIHWEEGNPHVHILYSARPYIKGEFSESKTISRDLRGPGGVRGLREVAAHVINKFQELAGLEDRVDPRSYAQRGIDLIPTRHKGWTAHQMERDGLDSKIVNDNQKIFEANKERIASEPGIILKELTSKQATFSENDVMKLVQNRLKDDVSVLGEYVFHTVMKEAVEVGKNIFEQIRYTSQDYADKEARILESLECYQGQKSFLKIDPLNVETYLHKLEEQGQDKGYVPNEGQINGIKTLCGDSQLYVMVGRAGTGKTTTLKAVVDLHKEAGYQVWSMAPSATAATQLGDDTGCYSDTISHFAYYWKKYDEALVLLHEATTDKEMKVAQEAIDKYKGYLPNSETLIIVDEAGMVGAGDLEGKIPGGWDAITKTIDKTGAKLALTGDDHQLKSIESSDNLRHLIYNLEGTENLCKLTEIKRQNIAWMREASENFSEFNVATALGMYENNGHIHSYALNNDIYKVIAREYVQNILKEPASKGAVIAATNEERQALNREIRTILKENGLLPEKDIMQIGEHGFAIGDKIVFTENDRGWNTKSESPREGFFVQNSMQGTIQSIKPCITVDKETGEKTKSFQVVAHVFDEDGGIKGEVTFDTHAYKAFTHGYAGTVWKNQGNTVDWVLAKLSKYIDANTLYVAATRHRDNLSMYYSTEDFTSYKQLVSSLSRINVKDMVVDYSISDENKEYWHNVQDYKATGKELLGLRTLTNSLDKNNKENKAEIEAIWENYKVVEADRKSWANHILRDWDVHRDFVRQAGLSKESLEIAAGLKKRSLSRVEIEAQQTVEQYVAVSLEARTLWRDIRRTHPGSRAKLHPEWSKFEEARGQRGVLANQIHINPVLHRPFLKETAENLAKVDVGYATKDQKISYSMGTIKAQAEAHQSKMLQRELLQDRTNPTQQDMLKVLIAYTENRDMAGAIWQEIRPKLKEFEGTLLKESFSKAISEYTEIRMRRDAAASQIMEQQEAFTQLAEKVGMKLDFEKLGEQAIQATRDRLFKTYQTSLEEVTKLEAAHELNTMIKGEAELKVKKLTISQVYQQGLQPKDIARDALEYQKLKLFEGLKTEPERALFLLLDEYDSKCRNANRIYGLCVEETKGKDNNAWESSHYPAYKAACHSRNDIALEVFDQRDHNQVLAMAEAMGMRFKETELQEIFSRCEQANRTNNIISYQKGKDAAEKGQAAFTLNQMIKFERKNNGGASLTAQQTYHAGIDFKELQKTVLAYGRLSVEKNLLTNEDRHLFHTLITYEDASLGVKETYRACIEESKEKSTPSLEVKPWETEKYKGYISLVTAQDKHAHELIKGHDAPSLTRIAKEMGISVAGIDVEAHRYSLRQTLQTFVEGDRTNVPMAAGEVLNWLEFDRHSDHKHTFKALREQDLWPKDIQKSLQDFFEKKREWRHETQRELKDAAKSENQGHDLHKPEYKTIAYERYQSFEEVDKQLKERMFELATDVLGNPTSRTSTQLRFGKKGSICIFTNGPKQGLYANHETGVYGGPLKLIEEQAGLSSAKDSLKWASEWLGGNPLVIEQRVVDKQQNEKQFSTWMPITPVPIGVEAPDIFENKYLSYMLRDGAKETHRHAYRDATGHLKGYVFRIEKADGSKFTPPLAYCENEKGFKAWKWRAFEKENKTPYGIEKLAQEPTKPILVVEGEKTADAAQKLLPEYNVLTWGGGAGNVSKTNWDCLAGREVIIWPDHDYDQGGQKAAQKLQKIVTHFNKEAGKNGSVEIVNLPQYLPNKWDLADKLPEGWALDTVREMIREATPQKSIEKGSLPLEKEGSLTQADVVGPQKSYSAEEREILAYLKDDINPEKHSWLRENLSQHLLNLAAENPLNALKEWQDLSADYSFKPSLLLEPLPKEQQEAYNIQAADVLTYLKDEISTEKHSWLRENLCQHLLDLAKDKPFDALKEWQELANDYSFKPSLPVEPFSREQQEAHKLQAADALAYLKDEISTEKHSWLREEYSKNLLNAAEADPLKTLTRWQEISGDYSFKPLMPEAIMSKEQLAFKETILDYLKGEVRPKKNIIADEKYCDKLFKMVDRDPLKSLQEWQKDSFDYSFNPFKEQLNDREIRVQEYIIEKILDEDHPFSKQKYADVTANLLDKPLEAYQALQLYTADKTFDPSTGIPKIEMEAQELMTKIKDFTDADLVKGLETRLNASPESVINECNALILRHEKDTQLESAVNKFVTLTEQLDKMAWHDPAHDETFHELSSLVEKNIKNKEFIRMVEVSKSSVAIEKLHNEIEERQQQHTMSRGM